MNVTREAYADKIAKLLHKAEKAGTTEEADAFLSKAQELMVTYAIDEAMLARAREGHVEEIVRDEILYHSTYSRAQFQIGATIARANDCQVLVRKGKDLMRTTLYLIGFKNDVERVNVLNASVQIQAMQAMNNWWCELERAPTNQREKFKLRREFLFSFAVGLQRKLALAKERGRTQATLNEQQRSNLTPDEAVESVALVLMDKQTRVRRFMDEYYGGNIKKGRATRFAGGNLEAVTAGARAGQNANTDMTLSRKELSR